MGDQNCSKSRNQPRAAFSTVSCTWLGRLPGRTWERTLSLDTPAKEHRINRPRVFVRAHNPIVVRTPQQRLNRFLRLTAGPITTRYGQGRLSCAHEGTDEFILHFWRDSVRVDISRTLKFLRIIDVVNAHFFNINSFKCPGLVET